MKFGLEQHTIDKLITVFEQYPKLDKAIVFGSRAKGNYKEGSDIDIAIKGRDLNFDDTLHLLRKLDEQELPYEIDLINYHSIKEPDLKEHIDRVGIELYSRWKDYTLGKVSNKITDGAHLSPKEFINGKIMFSVKDMINSGFDYSKPKTISQEDFNLLEKQGCKPEIDDILIAKDGSVLKHIFRVVNEPDYVLLSSIAIVKPKKEIIDPTFLVYTLKSPKISDTILTNFVSGSGVPRIVLKDFKKIDISVPPLPEQTAIASILSSLDDKIDLLQRQNKTLEQLAETIFRQWFVEEAEEQSNKKMILGDLIESVSITYKFKSGEAIFLNTSDIYLGEVLIDNYSSAKDLPGQAKKSIQKDDILFSEIRPANGRWAYIDFEAEDYVVSTKLMVLRSKGKINQAFIYFYLTHPTTVEWLAVLAESRSGTFPQITFDQLADLKINIPSEKRLIEIEEWCKMTLFKIKQNSKQIRTLTQTRDTLLPKLMSGELRVRMSEQD
ncbi:MAG: restriction endonuclease subunit S [Bacteroidetes bacterium]|nr:restriction endonuclease subunit S [Bacteroidota bacterium]